MAVDRERMNLLRQRLSTPVEITPRAFDLLKDIASVLNAGDDPEAAQELILLALEQRDRFGNYRPVLDSLVREVGLFPYLDPKGLSLADRFAYDFHRPLNLEDRDIVFHAPQAHVYRELMAGGSVVLSAPTSFGKSLVIDAVVASGAYRNILIIVPTIALIDETRRRLSRYRAAYKIITHASQKLGGRNVFILTQERVLELKGLEDVDFFVLDEFYKLNPNRGEDSRCALLNQVLYRLIKRRTQFYMLGPSVLGMAADVEGRLGCRVLQKPYSTVVSRTHRVDVGNDRLDALVRLCRQIEGPTIIFCSSPGRASDIARHLVSNGLGTPNAELANAIDWIASNYHPNWHFVNALARGVGVHHGRIPRALAQYVVRSFDGTIIKFLVCTSTLIEGVNTKAKNIIVFDNKIDKSKFDTFTFNNIRGRSGRMFEHFVGHVYLFHDPPEEELPLVDVPAITQDLNAPTSLLIQLDDEDLKDRARERLRRYAEQTILDYQVLQANVGIDLDQQLAFAADLNSNYRDYYRYLSWRGSPSWLQLLFMCDLMWKFFGGARLASRTIRKSRVLATLINRLQYRLSTRRLIELQLRYSPEPDDAVSEVLDFLRLWATIHFPKLLRAINKIQQSIFVKNNLVPGDYDAYAAQVEHLYMDPTLTALDEYGIPLQLARKLEVRLAPRGDLDDVLEKIKNLKPEEINLHPFEIEILRDAQRYL